MVLPILMGCSAPSDKSLYGIIRSVGLTANLKLCLDAGDALSYDGTAQVWTDRSGHATHFNRGTGSGSDSADPTFNGVSGRLSSAEYFSSDGGDYCTLAGSTVTWMDLHKDGAAFTILAAMYPVSASGQVALGTTLSGTQIGWAFHTGDGASSLLRFATFNGSAQNAAFASDAAVPLNSWSVLAVSVNENGGAGAGFLWRNGAYLPAGGANTWNPNYGSPNSSSISHAPMIGASADVGGAVNFRWPSGGRIAAVACWSGGALTKTQLDSIHSKFGPRFGL